MPRAASLSGIVGNGHDVPVIFEIGLVVNGARSRTERFFNTGGRFEIGDLDAGHYRLEVSANGSETRIDLDLLEGEHKAGIKVDLTPLVTVTGRVVDVRTRQPVADAPVSIAGARFRESDRRVSDAAGRFTISRVPVGATHYYVGGSGLQDYYGERTITGSGVIDIGDLPIGGSGEGKLGISFADGLGATISKVDPKGPAAAAGLVVGDRITTINGLSLAGIDGVYLYSFVIGPVGAKLTLGLERGGSVTVVLGP
jgi:hypothetical protein